MDHYAVLGVSSQATPMEIKAAYRALVKRHHPDAGGEDQQRILELNAAWEVLRDGERRRRYDAESGGARGAGGSTTCAPPRRSTSGASDQELLGWLQQVYAPIDRLLGQVINPFPAALKALSADPYDDRLMEAFCQFLEQSRARVDRVDSLFRSRACPSTAQGVGLSLYHCFGQVQDALAELERYTMGYVDSYLRDGREMLREAQRRRNRLHEERRRLEV